MTEQEKIKIDRISQAYLRECLHYCPNTGVFTWLERPVHHFKDVLAQSKANDRVAGKTAGTYSVLRGEMRLTLDGKRFLCSKLAVIYQVGQIGNKSVAHRNGDIEDNRLANLRIVPPNSAGTVRHWGRTNTGCVGVSRTKTNTFAATICFKGRKTYLGTYKTVGEAATVRRQAEQDFGVREQKKRA